MTSISSEKEIFTLINVFRVDEENQQQLVDLLIRATEETMKDLPGFVSAKISTAAMTASGLSIMRSGKADSISKRCSPTTRRFRI